MLTTVAHMFARPTIKVEMVEVASRTTNENKATVWWLTLRVSNITQKTCLDSLECLSELSSLASRDLHIAIATKKNLRKKNFTNRLNFLLYNFYICNFIANLNLNNYSRILFYIKHRMYLTFKEFRAGKLENSLMGFDGPI